MNETMEVQLSIADIWEYLRTHALDPDVGPFPKEKIVIGAGISRRKPGNIVEISRFDALAASVAWKAFAEGDQRALQDPRLAHVVETLGYLMGLQSGLEFREATLFGAWLSFTITGWNGGQNTIDIMRQLEQIAKQASFRPAVSAVIGALKLAREKQRSMNTAAV